MSVVRDGLSHFWGRDPSQSKVRVDASLKSNEGGLGIADGSRGSPDSELDRTNKQRETGARAAVEQEVVAGVRKPP